MIISRPAFEALFDLVETPAAEAGVQAGTGAPTYTSGFNLSILLTLAVAKRPNRILEVGTAWGWTAWGLSRVCPDSEIVAIDIYRELSLPDATDETLERENVGLACRRDPRCDKVQVITYDPRSFDISELGRFDLVFIDANHTYSHVFRDSRTVLGIVQPDAVIAWDDYWQSTPGVMRFVDELNSRVADWIVLVDGSRVCFCFLTPRRLRAYGEYFRRCRLPPVSG